MILFGTDGTGLWRVAEAGGVPSEVTRLDPSRKETFHAGPDFLPDGRHFLYHRIGGSEDSWHLSRLAGRKTGATEFQAAVGPAASSAAYAPVSDPGSSTGHCSFIAKARLWPRLSTSAGWS